VRFLVDQEFKGIESTESYSIKTGYSIGSATIEELKMDEEFEEVDETHENVGCE
jgi:hypothetical protein